MRTPCLRAAVSSSLFLLGIVSGGWAQGLIVEPASTMKRPPPADLPSTFTRRSVNVNYHWTG